MWLCGKNNLERKKIVKWRQTRPKKKMKKKKLTNTHDFNIRWKIYIEIWSVDLFVQSNVKKNDHFGPLEITDIFGCISHHIPIKKFRYIQIDGGTMWHLIYVCIIFCFYSIQFRHSYCYQSTQRRTARAECIAERLIFLHCRTFNWTSFVERFLFAFYNK